MAAQTSTQVAEDAFDRFEIIEEDEKIALAECIDKRWNQAIPAFIVGKKEEDPIFYLTTDVNQGSVGDGIRLKLGDIILSGGYYTIVCRATLIKENSPDKTRSVILKQSQTYTKERIKEEFENIRDVDFCKNKSRREDVQFVSVCSELPEVYQVDLHYQGKALEVHLMITDLVEGDPLGRIINDTEEDRLVDTQWTEQRIHKHLVLTLDILERLCRNVWFLHRKVQMAHTDLHDHNIIVDRLTGQTTIIDFDKALKLKVLTSETEQRKEKYHDIKLVCYHALSLLVFLHPAYQNLQDRPGTDVVMWMNEDLKPGLVGLEDIPRKVADKIYSMMKVIEQGDYVQNMDQDQILDMQIAADYFGELRRRVPPRPI